MKENAWERRTRKRRRWKEDWKKARIRRGEKIDVRKEGSVTWKSRTK